MIKRNHYYHGKLLKSDDFSLEQDYMLHKLKRIVSHTEGTGRLQGLQLSQMDTTHLLLEKGSAIDGNGNLIEITKNQVFTLQECDGFDKLDAYSGYLTLSYQEETSEKQFQSQSTSQHHEEYDYILDSFQLQIKAQEPVQSITELGFQETLIYQDEDIFVKRYLPTLLPRQGNLCFWIHVEQLHEVAGRLFYDMESSHYTLKQGWHSFQKQHSSWFCDKLYRIPEIAGEQASFHTKLLCIVKEKKEHTIANNDMVNIPFCDHIEEALRLRYYKRKENLLTDIYLGYVEFSYLGGSFQLLKVQDSNQYIACEKTDIAVHRAIELYGIDEVTEDGDEDQLSSGVLHVVLHHKEIWNSDEIEHGLNSSYVLMELGWMTQSEKRDRSLCFGNADLVSGNPERFLYSIQTFPNRGTFRIYIQPTNAMLNQQLTLHWIARAYQPNKKEPHLMYLRPQFVTLHPYQMCMFLPIFDDNCRNASVNYQLEQDQDGSIQRDGTYIAPSKPGLYQVKAIHRNEEVLSYVKVVDDDVT